MKKILVFALLFVGFQGFSKQIPGPSVLFSISEKILAQAQQLIFPGMEKASPKAKVKPIIKVKAKAPLKVVEPIQEREKPVQQIDEKETVKVKRDGMFIMTE